MRTRIICMLAGAALLALLSLIPTLITSGSAVSAQEAPRASARTETRPLSEVLARIGQSAGVVVLADSTLQQQRVPLPARAATRDTVETQIEAVKKALPAGTLWGKFYLPAPASGHWNGDDVAQYAHAQARLLGRQVGARTPAGTVEILGQQVPEEKATEYIQNLHLHLVYLLSNPAVRPADNWTQMTPEQRQQYIQQLSNLDPVARMQMLQQLHQQLLPQMSMLHALMSQMTDDEKAQMKQMFSEGEGGNIHKELGGGQ